MATSVATPTQVLAQDWLRDIARYDAAFSKWEKRVDKILKRYRDEDQRRGDSAKFNILWSNVQTLVPAVYSRTPKPDVSRRFNDNDPVGRVAALILERALEYEVQHYPDYRTTLRACIYDRFLGGRGTAWARYEPHMRAQALALPEDGTQVTEDADADSPEASEQVPEVLDYECAPTDYVHWKDFGHSVARTWDEVIRVWRAVYMTRKQLVDRFGDKGQAIPLDSRPDEMKSEREYEPRALIYEGWDKSTKQAVWISKTQGDVIDMRADPLKLEEFFPCPKPLWATLTNDTLVPVPDFTLYQDQAMALDILADRIDGLAKSLKVMGLYDASEAAIGRLFTEGENGTLIPVKNWHSFAEKNGLKGALSLVDLQSIYEALRAAYEAFAQQKDQVYEITGLSDIIRGQSVASETATAQQLKGQYASLRLKAYQDEVARFATECLQLKAQIICTQFEPRTIAQIAAVEQLTPADQQYIEPALALLVGAERMANPDATSPNPLRSFRVEVAADSMVLLDEKAEKESATEFLTAVGGFLQQGAEVAMQAPQVIPLIFEMIKFGAQKFRAGRQLEGVIDQALDQVQQQMMAPKPPPPPDPKVQAAEIEAQTAQQVEPIKAQAEITKAQASVLKADRELQTAQVQATMPVMMPGGMPQ